MKVHSTLGNGFQEVIYQRALAIEMEKQGLGIGLLINFGAKSMEFKRVYNVNHPENKEYIKNNPSIIKSNKS